MTDSSNPEVDPVVRPNPALCGFDLDVVLDSVVTLSSQVPEAALTAPVLGTERSGHGVTISEDGLVATIGYLITEADTVWLTDRRGRTAPAYVVGYDQDSGLGLVRALQRLDIPPLALGASQGVQPGDSVIVAASGGLNHALDAAVLERKAFAGYWEYVLDDAIFTVPAHPSWGGAALVDGTGALVGIGSLLMQSETQDSAGECNMFVPIDLLERVVDDLVRFGRSQATPKPWLGMFVYDLGEQLIVAGVFNDCPAQRADLRPGDLVVAVADQPVTTLIELFRSIWDLGEAGVEVPLTIVRDNEQQQVVIRSDDRGSRLHQGTVH